ncbi:MAG: DUF2029 domain-containing protein [Planctomycetes bacterium]|nr:DUF2029 domain-containing protein [Planctomycetota bacterium]MCC7171648.1 DUF2029 domain-containing protein [Planctomycetota bacterium]
MSEAVARRVAIAATIAIGAALAPLAALTSLRERPDLTILCLVLAGIPAAVLLFLRERTRGIGAAVLVAGLLARGLLLVPDDAMSDDVWRYRFEARVLLSGANPWRHAANADALAPLRDREVWPRVAHAEIPCVYPPLAVLTCAAIEAAAPSTRAFRVAFLLADLAVVWLLVRLARATGRDPALAAVWWLAPLTWIEIAGGGHFEPIAIALALAAFLAQERGRPIAAGVWLAAAVLVKPLAFVVLPCVVRRDTAWRTVVAAVGLVALAWTPVVASAGTDALLSFAARWSANAPVFPALLELANVVKDRLEQVALAGAYTHETNLRIFALDPERLARLASIGLCALICTLVVTRRIDRYAKAAAMLAFALVFSPVVQPWYLLWCVAFVALSWSIGTFVWTFTVVLAYHALIAFDWWGIAIEEPLLRAAQFLPVFALWIATALRRPRAPPVPPVPTA